MSGELDGIGYKVQQNLLKPLLIKEDNGIRLFMPWAADHISVFKVLKLSTHFNAELVGLELHHIYDFLDWVEEVELVEEFAELAGAELGIIKHVVNQKV